MGRVLVVDDDSLMASQIEIVLGHHGHDVSAAKSVEAALFVLEPDDFDVVILDVFMAGIGGLDGINEFRDWGWSMPIISTSAGYREMAADIALQDRCQWGPGEALHAAGVNGPGHSGVDLIPDGDGLTALVSLARFRLTDGFDAVEGVETGQLDLDHHPGIDILLIRARPFE